MNTFLAIFVHTYLLAVFDLGFDFVFVPIYDWPQKFVVNYYKNCDSKAIH